MPAEDHFIQRGLLRVKVNDYLRRELRRAGYAGVDLQKTPLGMRVVVYASRPGMVIGRSGTTVRTLTETLETEFGLEAPQIEVSEVEVPELNGSIMAERLAQRLERGDHFRRAAYGVLRRIIGANAKGVEISISGKLTSRRARYQKFRSGYVAKTGEPVRTAVSHGIAYAILKPGILGVQVRIMLPDLLPPDRPIIQHKELEVEVAPTPTEAEVVEEELPIEEAPLIEEFTEVSEEPVAPTAETEEGLPPPAVEEVPKEPVKEEKPAPKKPKPKPKKKVEKKPAKKPKPKAKAKPKKAEPKKKKEEKPKAKPKAKPKKKVEEKQKAKAKAKPKTEKEKAAKKAEKPKTKAKSSSKKSAAKKEKKSAKK